MIVALTFDGGRVHLRTRFVATKERVEEQQKKKFLYRGQMGTHPNSALKDTAVLLKSLATLRWPKLQYRNPSNTNVFYWGGKVSGDGIVMFDSVGVCLLRCPHYISRPWGGMGGGGGGGRDPYPSFGDSCIYTRVLTRV